MLSFISGDQVLILMHSLQAESFVSSLTSLAKVLDKRREVSQQKMTQALHCLTVYYHDSIFQSALYLCSL